MHQHASPSAGEAEVTALMRPDDVTVGKDEVVAAAFLAAHQLGG